MKIAFWHFYTFRLLRGIETLIISLANALAQKGVEVSIIAASPTLKPLVRPAEQVKVYTYPTRRYYSHLSIVPFYLNHFHRHRYDHIVAFFADFGEGLTWQLMNRRRKMPLTLYLCYAYSAVPHRYHSFVKYGWDRQARHILADGAWFAHEAERLFQRPVPVVPVGTNAKRFSPQPTLRRQMRAQLGYTDDDVVLLNVSALESKKGTWRGIQAIGRLVKTFPQIRYYILGQGEDEPRLREMVRQFNLQQQVVFGGTTAELEKYYNMADIFVMLPDAEANSVACHEAMSCGLPVLASASGGFSESVIKQAGFLVNPNSIADIDASLTTLISDPVQRQHMGQAGRTHILSNLTWDKVATQFLETVQ